ncbi:MAG: hypothetical protein LHW50_04075, partial [Candidatus Cloacimonetes bacterium]|nr:hypothetical protein [Candidatus Cloacimonadota bacterium]
LGDTIHAVLCAAGYNLRWLLRAIAAGRIRRLFYVLCLAVLQLVLIVFGILILDRQWLTRLAVTTG